MKNMFSDKNHLLNTSPQPAAQHRGKLNVSRHYAAQHPGKLNVPLQSAGLRQGKGNVLPLSVAQCRKVMKGISFRKVVISKEHSD